MSSLVEELQRDALDGNTDVSALLRKAYVVATKLNLNQFKEWCGHELNGYEFDPPEYRKIHGRLRRNPYHGWIPVMIADAETAQIVSTHVECGPVGPIQDLLNGPEHSPEFHVTLSHRVQSWLIEGHPLPLESMLHIGRAGLVGILDAVRNTILEWSLKLEAEGIVGQGMTFSKDEKEIARRNAAELQSIVNIHIENMTNSSIQQGSPNAGQHHIG